LPSFTSTAPGRANFLSSATEARTASAPRPAARLRRAGAPRASARPAGTAARAPDCVARARGADDGLALSTACVAEAIMTSTG
jgi:hypothetical protein